MRAEKVIFTYGRMRIYIRFDSHESKYTNAELAAKAVQSYPSLPIHSCINSKGPTFGAVIENTSIAHLLEHALIAEQSEMAKKKGVRDVTFVGITKWIDEPEGLAEVQVSFIDDLDAATALSRAIKAIESFR